VPENLSANGMRIVIPTMITVRKHVTKFPQPESSGKKICQKKKIVDPYPFLFLAEIREGGKAA